ncbi:MAG: hypothetical protein TV42_00140 [Wolbachia endosymbiont of Dactylopius coccus]|nr:MAG: hypothetical protein TV42_00140 [Wolbachia endosymbiont of Dactylopius coccus]
MNTNDTQQEHIYNERIQEIFPLFDKIKKEDDPIYNARVDFNTVKFLTKHANWNWDEEENKDKAYGVILQKCDKTKKAGQELESEVKERLKEYVDDVAGVSIYGNHASITLGDDKKEFKISEFLNSDFCQKNGISGFSTLHSDGKSGMHGFVAEEGGKKIRHYVVTDGSYEMTLNWYVNGEKCTIKVNIDKEGVNLIEPNSVTEQLKKQLEVNKDVKIGGLYLHEIKFREKGKVNEVQHDGKDNQVLNKSSEIAIKSNSRDIEQEIKKPVQKHQATHMNREIGSQTPPLPPLRTSSLPPKENVVNEQGRNASAKPVSQDGGQRDKQNNPTPNNQQKGATSDPSDSSTFTKSVSHNQDNRQKDERYDNPTFGHAVPGSQKPDRSEQTPNNQQQPKTQQQEGNNKGDLLQDIRNFKRNSLRRTGVDDKKVSIDRSRENDSLTDMKAVVVPESSRRSGQESEEERLNYQNTREALESWKEKRLKKYGINEDVKETSFNTPEKIQSELQKDDLADVKTVEGPTVSVSASTPNSISDSGYISPTNGDSKSQTDLKQVGRKLEEHINLTPFEELKNTLGQENLGLKPADQSQISEETKKRLREVGLLKDSSTDVKTNDSGYSSPTHANHGQSQVNPGQLKASLMNVEQRDDTLLTEFTSKLDKETQKFPLKPVDQKEMSEQTKEHLLAAGLLKDSSTDVKTNDSGYSSPTHTDHSKSQTNFGQLEEKLKEYVKQSDLTPLKELAQRLNQKNYGLKQINPETRYVSPQTKKHLIEAGLLKDNSTDIKTVAEQENNDTNSIVDKNSNLYKLLEKDEAQLKIGVIEEERKDTLTEHTDSYDRNRIALGNRNKRPLDWAKRIAESQEKDTNKSILM